MRSLIERISILIWAATLLCSLPAPAAIDPALSPFVTAGTLLIARADLSRFDPAAADAALIEAAQSALGAVNCRPLISVFDPHLPDAQRWLADFRTAGGKIVYAVAFLGDPASMPGVLIVPVSQGADAKAIAALLVSGRADGPDHRDDIGLIDDNQHPVGLEAILLNGDIVFGAVPQVEKMKAVRPVDRPLLADAMDSLGDAPFEVVFSPSVALDLVAGELLPEKLPDELGGGSPALLLDSLAWAALGGTAPPGPTLKLLIQCKDSDGAQGFSDLYNTSLASQAIDAAQKQLPAALKLTVQDNRLSLTVDAPTMSHVVLPRLLSAINGDRISRLETTQPSTLP
jgi:hypothetical protein